MVHTAWGGHCAADLADVVRRRLQPTYTANQRPIFSNTPRAARRVLKASVEVASQHCTQVLQLAARRRGLGRRRRKRCLDRPQCSYAALDLEEHRAEGGISPNPQLIEDGRVEVGQTWAGVVQEQLAYDPRPARRDPP
jgi:hypothetical protein